eukprot:1008996_1
MLSYLCIILIGIKLCSSSSDSSSDDVVVVVTNSPTSNTASPTANTASPTSNTASPTANTASPTSNTVSPTPNTASPTPNTASPTPNTASPTVEDIECDNLAIGNICAQYYQAFQCLFSTRPSYINTRCGGDSMQFWEDFFHAHATDDFTFVCPGMSYNGLQDFLNGYKRDSTIIGSYDVAVYSIGLPNFQCTSSNTATSTFGASFSGLDSNGFVDIDYFFVEKRFEKVNGEWKISYVE